MMQLRPIVLMVFALAAGAAMTRAQSVDIYGGYLLNNNSTPSPIPDGSEVLIVVATGSGGFSALQAGSSLSVGSFLNSNDQIIAIADGGSLNDGTSSGAFSVGTAQPLNTYGSTFSQVQPGQAVELVWFSNLDFGASTLTAGNEYGTYTTTIDPQTSDSWLIPASNGSVDLTLETTDFAGGTVDPSQAEANDVVISAVPEPANWGLIAGAAALMCAIVHRKRHRLSESEGCPP